MDPNLLRECSQHFLETADFSHGTNWTTAATFTAQMTTTTVMQQTEQMMQPRPNSSTNRDTVRREYTQLVGYQPQALSQGPQTPFANSRAIRC